MHDELYQNNHVMNLPSGVLVPVCRHGEPEPAVLCPLVNHCTTCVNIKTKPSTYTQLKQQKSPHFANFSLFFTLRSSVQCSTRARCCHPCPELTSVISWQLPLTADLDTADNPDRGNSRLSVSWTSTKLAEAIRVRRRKPRLSVREEIFRISHVWLGTR